MKKTVLRTNKKEKTNTEKIKFNTAKKADFLKKIREKWVKQQRCKGRNTTVFGCSDLCAFLQLGTKNCAKKESERQKTDEKTIEFRKDFQEIISKNLPC